MRALVARGRRFGSTLTRCHCIEPCMNLHDTNADVKPLLRSVDESAIILGVSVPTVWRLIRDKKIKAVRNGGRTQIPMSVLEEYVADLLANHVWDKAAS